MPNTLEGGLHPETAYPALVFYQLRRLWQSGLSSSRSSSPI
jgi:hypothetical protein